MSTVWSQQEEVRRRRRAEEAEAKRNAAIAAAAARYVASRVEADSWPARSDEREDAAPRAPLSL
jgi:hypothetical protein